MNEGWYGLAFAKGDDGEAEIMRRLVGHALVAFMPAVELDETIDTLSEYYAFHALPKEHAPEVQVRMIEGRVTAESDDWSVVS